MSDAATHVDPNALLYGEAPRCTQIWLWLPILIGTQRPRRLSLAIRDRAGRRLR